MVDFESRILAAAHASAKSGDNRKRDAFARLPESHKALLRQVAEMFGKPVAVKIHYEDGQVYASGTFVSAMDFDDFRARLPKPLYQRKRGGK